MTNELTKKAAEMLLQGASLLGQPCPYCSGVRVMKDGYALCVSCGREPRERNVPKAEGITGQDLRTMLENKLSQLSAELEIESDHTRQQEILKSVNAILDAMEKLSK